MIGSVHPKSTEQIDKLIETYHINQIYVPWDALLHSKTKPLEALGTQAVDALARGADLVIRTCRSANDAAAAGAEGRKAGMSGAEPGFRTEEGRRGAALTLPNADLKLATAREIVK